MTPLERALRDRIKVDGPITVEAYMEACNSYYYATRDPFGANGDFTTAPEISQMFGEMIGAALADCWTRAGAPQEAAYVELGPGRGTLTADALRVMRSAGFSGEIHFVETSPVLRNLQQQAVPDAHHHEGIDDLPTKPLLLIANEFLDALPVRQHVDGTERKVIIVAGGLAFDRDGDIVETSPAREQAARSVAEHLVKHGGAAIFIDYGHERSGHGDTLQAMRSHRFAPALTDPGEQDLTAHVDFEAVVKAVREAGADATRLSPQCEWLRRLGIEARASDLSQRNPARADDINAALDRLTTGDAMGDLFKVIAIHAPDWPPPAGFE